MKVKNIARLLTPLNPTMDVLYLETFAFFVPNRIVWDEWKNLMGENTASAWVPGSPANPVPHYNQPGNISSGSIADYYGIPPGTDAGDVGGINILPFRGYVKIWNEWFRNQNVQAPNIEYTDSSDNTGIGWASADGLLKVNKKHDLFTSCLPQPQKGDNVDISPGQVFSDVDVFMGEGAGSSDEIRFGASSGVGNFTVSGEADNAFPHSIDYGSVGNSNVFARTSDISVGSINVNELRLAFQTQKMLEKDARGGTRYIEYLKTHFGVDAGDYRLQRPEFLGSSRNEVGIHQVEQNFGTADTELGKTGAFGYSNSEDYLFEKSFVEHGSIHIFAVIRQKNTYQQGLPKLFSKKDRLDFYQPSFAHIGEQPVLNKEIYSLGGQSEMDDVFGYNEAWYEYRYKPNSVSGKMRSNVPNTFDIWHYADKYDNAPVLSDDWMKSNAEITLERTLGVQDSDQLIADYYFESEWTRPMPVVSIPGMIDHF